MYYLTKKIQISASHQLKLSYQSACERLHGHNWNIVVHCKNEDLNEDGMIIDFTEIKKIVNQFDHQNINDIMKGDNGEFINPTAENMAKYLCDSIPYCYKIEVEETDGNKVIYEP